MNNNYVNSFESSKVGESTVIKNIFIWMAAGLGLTGFIAQGLFSSGLVYQIARSGMMFPLIIGEFVLVFFISKNIMKLKAQTGLLLFLLYAALNGVTLSTIFLVYTRSSISNTFFITALLFGVMAFYGVTTKKDLTKMSTYLMMGLIGIIVATVVNIFIGSNMLHYLISVVGVVVFTGLTAHDVQKFSRISQQLGSDGGDSAIKVSIIGALNLYLDFINLFLFLLRFGQRR
ncbi:MAG: hypothetical protein B6229_05425 [Spirochaetaceae bacterium 4572_7]|nr:MAG: hypothetical protein B6229_05425 [Spirochaetaceae bacterium 4572_7]